MIKIENVERPVFVLLGVLLVALCVVPGFVIGWSAKGKADITYTKQVERLAKTNSWLEGFKRGYNIHHELMVTEMNDIRETCKDYGKFESCSLDGTCAYTYMTCIDLDP